MADIDIDLDGGAAKLCNNCDTRINEAQLNSQLALLRELEAEHFYVCEDCVTIVDNGCQRCGGAVYLPRKTDEAPSLCPACRNDIIKNSGDDPGWNGWNGHGHAAD